MKTTNFASKFARRAHRALGFTLVELLVAMAVGLTLTLMVTGTVLTMGRQMMVVGSNVAAQGSAQIALSLIDGAGRSAGAGLYNNGQLICPTINAWRAGTLIYDSAPMMPARIIDGGAANVSDTIIFTGATGAGAKGAFPVLTTTSTGAPLTRVSDASDIQLGDLALLAAPGSDQPCLLFQESTPATPSVAACGGNATRCTILHRAGGMGGYNPPMSVFTNEPRYGFAEDLSAVPPIYGPAVVMNLGAFEQTAFGVQCQSLIQFDAFTAVPACTLTPLGFSGGANALAMDVVLMHAQYGITATAASDVVVGWFNATGGTWANPIAADIARIKALRVVVVVRSKEADPNPVTAAACTNTAGVVNTGPCSFQDASAPVIDLGAVPVPAGKTWRNYRYRVHQTVVPLRNVIWSN